MNLDMILVWTTFWSSSTLFFQTHVHAFSTTTLTGFLFCIMRFIFASCQLFLSTVWMFLEFVQMVRLKRTWKWRWIFLERWWIQLYWIHQHDENVFRPPPLHVAKAKQLKQKKFNYSMLHVHDRQFTLLCFPVWKRELSFAVTAVVFLGFNLLNARRGVKPTLATLGAVLVVVIRSCWIFAFIP